jgi:hypothetical protein
MKNLFTLKSCRIVRGTYRNGNIYPTMKLYIQKQMMSVKSWHILLLSYKISIPIYALLPALKNLKDVSAVKSVPAPRNKPRSVS